MSRGLRFTEDAQDDLVAIWLYTAQHWGDAQADTYQDALHHACHTIAEGHAATRPVEGVPSVRWHHCKRHFVFFVDQPDAVIIIAVLHERMDLPARLAARLRQA